MQCGFRVAEFEELQASLLKHGVTQPVIAVKESEYGVKYVLECSLVYPLTIGIHASVQCGS